MARHSWVKLSIFTLIGIGGGSSSAVAQVTYDVVAGFDQSVPAATQPEFGVIRGSDGALYGTTQNGNFCGAVYKILSDGTRTILHVFNGSFAAPPHGPDGCHPVGELVEAPDGNLYGATLWGGSHTDAPWTSGAGTIFRISKDGSVYDVVHHFGPFPYADGAVPQGGLTLGLDGNLYGTTSYGGSAGGTCTANAGFAGTFYQLTLGGAVTVQHHFRPETDGCAPIGNLTLAADGSFLGATIFGGYSGTAAFAGTIFKMTVSGSFSPLFMFPGSTGTGYPYGSNPTSAPIEGSDGSLYGTASGGGPPVGGTESGTIYRLSPFGSTWEPTLLHAFTGPDGAQPLAGLTAGSDGDFYGVTAGGGAFSNGTVFRISPEGSVSSPPLHTFGCVDIDCTGFDPDDGFAPQGRLLETSPGEFMGTTSGGNGSTVGGSIFRIALLSATTTGLAASTDAAVYGESVTFTATVSSAGGAPTGQVQFFDGSTSLGTTTLTSGEAVLATTSLSAGAHSISAEYLGDGSFQQSTSSTVTVTVSPAQTTTTLASSPNPSSRRQAVTLTASVTRITKGGSMASGQVQFFDGKKRLGTAPLVSGRAFLPVTFKNSGSHDLTAIYSGDGNFIGSASAVFTHTVTR